MTRIQRQVPERRVVIVWARQFGKSEYKRHWMEFIAGEILRDRASAEALVSGAMPAEFSPAELRLES